MKSSRQHDEPMSWGDWAIVMGGALIIVAVYLALSSMPGCSLGSPKGVDASRDQRNDQDADQDAGTDTDIRGDDNSIFNFTFQFAQQHAGWGLAGFLLPFLLTYWRAARKAAVAIEGAQCDDCKSRVQAQRWPFDPADWWLRTTGNRERVRLHRRPR